MGSVCACESQEREEMSTKSQEPQLRRPAALESSPGRPSRKISLNTGGTSSYLNKTNGTTSTVSKGSRLLTGCFIIYLKRLEIDTAAWKGLLKDHESFEDVTLLLIHNQEQYRLSSRFDNFAHVIDSFSEGF